MRTRWAPLRLALLTCLILSGCASNSIKNVDERTRLEAEIQTLGESKSSKIDGFPIPSSAKPVEGQQGLYQLPEVSYEAVHGWYDRTLPRGEDWKEWKWCFGGESDSPSLREYRLPVDPPRRVLRDVKIDMYRVNNSDSPILRITGYNHRMKGGC